MSSPDDGRVDDAQPDDVEPDDADAVSDADGDGKADAVSDGDADASDTDVVDRAEALADRALSAFVNKVDLPDVRAEAARARAFFKSIDSWAVWSVLIAYFCAAGAGVAVVMVGVPPLGTLPDWYMHAAMYVVMFSFLILYVKAHLMGKRVTRAVMALLTLAQLAFFAWILFDRIPARTLVLVEEGVPRAVDRPTFTLLALPGWLLIASAATLLLHWLILARFRRRAADLDEDDSDAFRRRPNRAAHRRKGWGGQWLIHCCCWPSGWPRRCGHAASPSTAWSSPTTVCAWRLVSSAPAARRFVWLAASWS